MHGYDPNHPPLDRIEVASRADIDEERDRRLRERFIGQDGRRPAFRQAGVWHWQDLDPAGGELALPSPERKVRPAVEPTPKPSRTRASLLNTVGIERLSAVFSLAARKNDRAEIYARWNIRNKLHLNPRQPTLEQTWNRGVPTPLNV